MYANVPTESGRSGILDIGQRSDAMKVDEQEDYELSIALSAPGQFDVTQSPIGRSLAGSLQVCEAARMRAPGLGKTKIDSTVMVFRLHRSQTPVARSAAPLGLSITIH
jgi:hypothetical protein